MVTQLSIQSLGLLVSQEYLAGALVCTGMGGSKKMVDFTVLIWGYLFPVVFLGYLIIGIGKEIIQQIKNK
jgi:hypothetical protein|tara:strand:- start:622 stop:831 length:210 start_codon:yes stop_codon:yes gene_type:complete